MHSLSGQASENRSSDDEEHHDRKRAKVDKSLKDNIATPFSLPNVESYDQQRIQGTSEGNTTPAPISFEAKIALALQGSNWQALQNNNSDNAAIQSGASLQEVATSVLTDTFDKDDVDKPPEMNAKQKKKKANFDRTIQKDTGEVLQSISVESLTPVAENVSWDDDPELLCSYNWQASAGTNTIFVPGEPAKWSPRPLPHKLEPDTGLHSNDYNYARQPRTPFEPMFAALGVMNPNYQFKDIDVLSDRNSLRTLLEFVQGKANGPLRLDLFCISNTLVIIRNESKWWKYADGKSYGCNFEDQFTRPAAGMEDATNHYRAIRFPMGPLNVVVRFEADAYDDGVAASDTLTESEMQAVTGGLATRPSFNYSAPVQVLQQGHIVPTAQMVELKTQAFREEGKAVTCQDQLWFGRTSLLYTAPYGPGTGEIKKIRYEDAMKRVKTWEGAQQDNLRKLVTLLLLLKNAAKKENGSNRGVVLVREDKSGPLTVRRMNADHCAFKRVVLQRHWRHEPVHQQPGEYRGQRGRGGYHPAAPRGRGDFNGGRGRGQLAYMPNPHTRGGFAPQSYGGERGQPAYAPNVHARGGYVPQAHGRGGYAPQTHGRGGYAPQSHGRGGNPPQGNGRGGHPPQGNTRGGHPSQGNSRGGYPNRGGYGRGQ
jgi:hypothetical protein